MAKTDYTLLKDAEVSFEEKKSVFICNIKRITNEQEALGFIQQIKQRYKDASHNVSAYITNNGISMRYSDDGEPQGTAGPPVLEVLKREQLNDVAAVVTRYFGGVLLGAGGLVRAYGASVKQGVDAAGKVRRTQACLLVIGCSYELYGKLNHYFSKKNVVQMNSEFLEDVTLEILCLKDEASGLLEDLTQMANGGNLLKRREETCCFIDENGLIMENK